MFAAVVTSAAGVHRCYSYFNSIVPLLDLLYNICLCTGSSCFQHAVVQPLLNNEPWPSGPISKLLFFQLITQRWSILQTTTNIYNEFQSGVRSSCPPAYHTGQSWHQVISTSSFLYCFQVRFFGLCRKITGGTNDDNDGSAASSRVISSTCVWQVADVCGEKVCSAVTLLLTRRLEMMWES